MTYLVEYSKGWPVAVHTSVESCAKALGIKVDTVHFRCTPAYMRRNPDSVIVKVKMED